MSRIENYKLEMALQTTALTTLNLTDFVLCGRRPKEEIWQLTDLRRNSLGSFKLNCQIEGLLTMSVSPSLRLCVDRKTVYRHNNRSGQNNKIEKLKMSRLGRHLIVNLSLSQIVIQRPVQQLSLPSSRVLSTN